MLLHLHDSAGLAGGGMGGGGADEGEELFGLDSARHQSVKGMTMIQLRRYGGRTAFRRLRPGASKRVRLGEAGRKK